MSHAPGTRRGLVGMTDTPYSDELDEILGNLREDAVEYGEELHHGKVKSDDDIKLASEKLLNVQSEAKQRLSRLLIEARIDEVNKYLGAVTMGYSLDEYRAHRLTELKEGVTAELKEEVSEQTSDQL